MSDRPEAMPDAATLPPLPSDPIPAAAEAATILPPAAADTPDETPRPVVPGYEILRELGRGGMGVVYQARQVALNRVVALKMILAGGHAGEDELARFRLEAEALALLRHPNIVQIYEVGRHEGRPFLALEFLEGGSLAGQLKQGTPPPTAAAALVEALARAVHAAHERGIVHRDLKPENVLLDRDGTPKITDFGLAKRVEDKAGQTASNAVVGTPSYMAPEQAEGKSRLVGPTADVYALGAILYRLLTGRPPFEGPTTMDVLLQVVAEEPVPPRRRCPQVPRDLDTISLKCLRKQPADRYADALELAEDLRRFQGGEPIRARPVGRVERLFKWARRRPALAAACVLGVLVLLLGVGGASTFRLWQRAEGAQQRAEMALQEATATRDQLAVEKQSTEAALERERVAKEGLAEARRDLERLSYYRAVDLALREWRDNEMARAEHLLRNSPASLRGWEWHYVRRLCRTELLVFSGHTGDVHGVAFSPDGSRLASASQDGTVKVWESQTGQLVRTLQGHSDWVSGVAFSPDGKRLASASGDGTVKLWDVHTGQEERTLKGHTKWVSGVAFSPDGRRLASASEDRTVRVWDAHTGQELSTLRRLHYWVSSVAFSPDGRRLACAACSADQTVEIWDVQTGQQTLSLKHTQQVSGVAFSPDGKRLASAPGDGTVRLWDAHTGLEERTLMGHTGRVLSVSFSPDGGRLASASMDRTVKVWDALTGQEVRTLRGHTDRVSGVTFSPDGQRLASASADRTVRVWDAQPGQVALTLKGHTGGVRSVAFSPEGGFLASAGAEIAGRDKPGEVKVWDAYTGREARTLRGHTGGIEDVCFSPDGRRLASASWDMTVKIWDTATGREIHSLKGHIAWVKSLAFSADGRRLASASRDHTVKVWDVQTGQEVRTLRGHASAVYGVAFSPDGCRLASASADKTVMVWDAQTGHETFTLAGHTAVVWGVSFSPDGRRLASASWDRTVRVWDAATGKEIRTLQGHTEDVSSVTFSPDGHRLASGSGDKSVKLWDAQTGQEALTLKGHTGFITSVAFSPDGRRLASASLDGTVKVWDATPLPDPPAPPVAPAKP
jgi:WD40 repeat protein